MPGYAIQWMEVDGPLDDESTSAGYSLLFGELPLKRLPASAKGGLILKVPSSSAAPTPGPPTRRGFGGPRFVDVRVEVETDQPRVDAERLLRAFMQRAYDRPVEDSDLRRYLQLFDNEYGKGVGFVNAMVTVYSAVLVSPGYLYLDYAPASWINMRLASRISLFLWNSKPDAELRKLVDAKRLADPRVLQAQVDRMLNDSRSRRLSMLLLIIG